METQHLVKKDGPVYLTEILVTLKADRRRRYSWLAEAITSSEKVHRIFRTIWDDDISLRERFYLLVLNSNNHIIGYHCLSLGGLSAAMIDGRLLFGIALRAGGVAVIVAHNHPSGALQPSDSDLKLTERLRSMGDLTGIKLLDHLILIPEVDQYYSMADKGDLG